MDGFAQFTDHIVLVTEQQQKMIQNISNYRKLNPYWQFLQNVDPPAEE